MADTNFRGPVSSMGSLEVQGGTAANIEPLDGPSITYQGWAAPDVRSVPFAKDGTAPARVPAFLSIQDAWAVDNIPQAASSTLLATTQVLTATVVMSLVTAQVNGPGAGVPSVAVGVPFLPAGTTVATTANIALDLGFATGTTAANSSTVIVNDNTQFTLGQWIVIGGAANSAGSASLLTQVLSLATSNVTGMTVGPSLPQATFSNAPIGAANLWGAGLLPPATQFGPSAPVPNSHSVRVAAGLARVMNPAEMIARNLTLTAGTTAATTSVEFFGWDVWGNAMTETLTMPSGNRSASTIFGKKAWKYLQSAIPSTSIASTFSIGVGDVFGVPFRADQWEQTQIFWNGCSVPTSLGFSTAATTAPATNTTGDVRGTIQVSTNGTGSAAAVATAQVSNGAARLAIVQNIGVWNQLNATPLNTVPMFGVAQSTT